MNFNNLEPLEVKNMQCGFPQYGSFEQCSENAIDELEIDMGDKLILIPVCKHHEETWLLIYGHKGLGYAIARGKIKYEERQKV